MGSVPTDKLFTSQRLDGTGLYFYNARYYDPTIGRFISPDSITHSQPLPIGQVIKGLTVYLTLSKISTAQTINPIYINPQEHNRYTYALNNPYKFTDPDGHQYTEASWALQQTLNGWYQTLTNFSQSLPPQVKWIVAIGSVTVGGAIWLEQKTGWLSATWGDINNEFKNFTGNDNAGNNSNKNNLPKTKRDNLLEQVSNKKLRNTIDQLYRPGSSIGDGGTADAIRWEINTGKPINGVFHINKGFEGINNLQNILRTQNLTNTERNIAQDLITDLQDALSMLKP